MVTVRFFAGARAAAGVPTTSVDVSCLADLITTLAAQYGERLAVVLTAAGFLVDGLACHDRQAELPTGATVDVLPPFAGG